ncbi:L-tyrosine 3-hydroxylase [Streptomyces sp. NPDC058877]|uniref:L-tyrosine 3-hydroxylase n=1 Tax=Streptomyces sp. NPDC058877 TaxID=3346665 RepID=UPI0036CD8836
MNVSDARDLSTAPPRSDNWEYGGHLYGLEPLALPAKWSQWTPAESSLRGDAAEISLGDPSAWECDAETASELRPADDGETDRLFWFRWITGHQTTFTVWQLLAETLHQGRLADTGPAADELARRARCLVRVYSLMLLYASSPPQETYERVIRDPMARQHPNLSGAWARDYGDIRPLIRGRIGFGSKLEAAELALECQLNEQIHEGIAARVVPSGVSLLLSPKARRQTRQLNRETLLWLYDGIFLTSRAPVSRDTVVRQLIRRIHAILLDIRANGLYPLNGPDSAPEPPELMTDSVLALKDSFAGVLRELVDLSRLSAADVGQPVTAS